jgi:hypothetical protein
MTVTTAIFILVLFQLKHFLADYPLQSKYMLGKGKEESWFLPLLSHVGVHTAFTFVIALHFINVADAFRLALLDGIIHLIMDRVKASPELLGRFKLVTGDVTSSEERSNKLFWWSFGFDQLIHQLTYCIIIFIMTKFK